MLTVKKASLDWALAHALSLGDTDVLPIPFEYLAIRYDWGRVRAYLASQDLLQWVVRPHRRLLAPKARYGFRVVTQLDPLDFLLFAALVKEIGADVEDCRVPISQQTVFSYRFAPRSGGGLFDPKIGFASFQTSTRNHLERSRPPKYVAVADIADFYPRIYLHRLENALAAATSRTSHVAAVMRLLEGWNSTETFGIPVGSAPSRLLAEVTIADVDEALLANGITFVRFNDDYRMFAKTHSEAYRSLVFLADNLHRMHGLTLQPQKTSILSRRDFMKRFLRGPEDRELVSLQATFISLVELLGLEDPYGEIVYADLDDEQRTLVDSMNLAHLFREELDKRPKEPDQLLMRFILRRLGQLGDDSVVDSTLSNLDSLYPIFPDIVFYLQALGHLEVDRRKEIGRTIIGLLGHSIVSELPFHRLWALNLFTHSTEWDNEGAFVKLYNEASDDFSRRELILAMGRCGHTHWFQGQWRGFLDLPPWPRRALLAGASCMPGDARRHWYRSLDSHLDPLERAVAAWAKKNPFALPR